MRDVDGLALSSRNVRLSRRSASARSLSRARSRRRRAARPDPVAAARASLDGLDPDYVELADLDGATVLAAAVRVGSTRLIDNVLLEGELMSDTRSPRAMRPGAGKLPLPELAEMKRRGDKIVMVTAYDAPERRASRRTPAST